MTAFVKCCGAYRLLPIQRRGRHTFAKCPTCGLCWHQLKPASKER